MKQILLRLLLVLAIMAACIFIPLGISYLTSTYIWPGTLLDDREYQVTMKWFGGLTKLFAFALIIGIALVIIYKTVTVFIWTFTGKWKELFGILLLILVIGCRGKEKGVVDTYRFDTTELNDGAPLIDSGYYDIYVGGLDSGRAFYLKDSGWTINMDTMELLNILAKDLMTPSSINKKQ
jgi:hypothetical protein